MIKDLSRGAADLVGGFGLWRSRPRLMALALLPALAVLVVMVGLLGWLGFWLVGLVPGWTGFADSWPGWSAALLRLVVSSGIVLALALVLVVTYSTVTLAVGDPVYARISKATDDLLGPVPDRSVGWRTWLADTLHLAGVGAGCGLLAAVIGLLPGIGTAISVGAGFIVSSWLLATGLTAGAMERHGLDRTARARLLRTRPWRVLGFGLLTQALFLIPLGAVLVMPAATSGATRLARGLLGR